MTTPKTTRSKDVASSPDEATLTPARASGRYQPGRSRYKNDRRKATFEGSRDNRPVILGWGRNLPAAKKTHLQRRLYYLFAGVMVALVVGVFAFGVINVNIIQPNLPISTVNGQQIPQKAYRAMVAYLAQDTWNQLEAATIQQNALNQQLANEKDATKQAALNTQINAVQTTISSLQTAFSQTQLDQLASDNLIEDALIQQGATRYERQDPTARAALTVTAQETNAAYTAFGKAFPAGQSLGNFKSQNGLSDQDIKAAINVKLRRNLMDKYQQSLVTSPTLQVHFARIQFDSKTNAQNDLALLKKDPSQWNALAKKDSLDVNSRDNGGDMGWVALGQSDQGIEGWLFATGRKAGDMTDAVIKEISGTFDIVKVIAVDPHRTLDSGTITSLKGNALSHWLTGQRDLPPTVIKGPDQTMFNNTADIPQTPNLNVSFGTPTAATGP